MPGSTLLALIFLTPFLSVKQTDPVELTVLVPETEISVAKSFQVKVSVSTPQLPYEEQLEAATDRVFTPEAPSSAFYRIEGLILKEVKTDTTKAGNQIKDSWTYILEPQLPGDYEIPAFEVICDPHDSEAEPIRMMSDPVALKVSAVIANPKEAELRDSIPPVKKGIPRWLLILTAILLWIGVRYAFWRLKKSNSIEFEVAREKTALKLALEELDQTDNPGTVHRILSRAVSDRYGIFIDSLTEEDIRQQPSFPAPQANELADISHELQPFLFGTDQANIAPELKARVRRFLQSIL